MKIKIFSDHKGVILAAVLPTDRRTRNLTECGPLVVGKNEFQEIELPRGTRGAAVSGLFGSFPDQAGEGNIYAGSC